MRVSFRIILVVALLACGLLLSSCEKVEAVDPVFEEKEKTILLYMACNNNLAPDAADNINKILEGYLPTDGNLVIFSSNLDLENKALKDTIPLLVNLYKTSDGIVVCDTIYRFPYANSATKSALTNAMSVVQTMLPAKEYGLILWSHGTGWLPPGYYSSDEVSSSVSSDPLYNQRLNSLIQKRERELLEGKRQPARTYTWPSPPGGVDPYAHMFKSFGYEEGTEMSITDLSSGIPYKVDFIMLDACLMGGIEVIYQLRNLCDYIISSPAEILTAGFSYGTVIEPLFAGDYDGATKAIYDFYAAQSGWDASVTVSCVRTSGLDELAAIAKDIFDLYRDNIQSLNINKIQPYFRYDKHWFYDIKDFIDSLAGEDAQAFDSALNELVTSKYTTGKIVDLKIDTAHYSGVSCYINNPENSTLDAYYQGLDWGKAAGMIK